MNIVQLHEKVKFWIDHVNSPRFTSTDYDSAINSAIIQIVDDRYNNLKENKQYSFESSQRIRDELYTLVKRSSGILATSGYIPFSGFPADYKYMLAFHPIISGVAYSNAKLTTYDEYFLLYKNPFGRPTLDYPELIYHLEFNLGHRVYFGSVGTLQSAVIDYLAIPATVNKGIIHTVASGVFTATKTVIALETTVYATVTYYFGQEISVAISTNITSGSVAENYTNTDLPVSLHEEIAKVAASILNKITEDYNKGIVLENESKKS